MCDCVRVVHLILRGPMQLFNNLGGTLSFRATVLPLVKQVTPVFSTFSNGPASGEMVCCASK
jgi:hypothetical protein